MSGRRLTDLRQYLEALADRDDLQVIDREVDPRLELGAIIRHSYETRSPAPLFTRLKGTDAGMRVLGAPAGLSSRPEEPMARVALSLGMEPSSSARAIVEALLSAWGRPPLPPRLVADAPVKRNILRGPDVDLERFPLPLLHAGDGGRYFNTWGTIVVRTPDEQWTNWSIARIMATGRDTMTGTVLPIQHLGIIHRMWAERGEPMPFVLAQGCEPCVPIVSGMPLPERVDEAGFIGAFLDEPVDVIRCESHDLCVPASAEIVVEGHVSIDQRALEGPVGEYAGYLSGEPEPQPVFQIDAISYRDEPILPVVVAGEPSDEDHTVAGLLFATEALRLLRAEGLPVTFAWIPLPSAFHWMVVTVPLAWPGVAGSPDSTDLTRRIAEVVFHSRIGPFLPKVFVLDDDVDPTDTDELVWAIATRTHPSRGHAHFDAEPIIPLMMCYSDEERRSHSAAKTAYNCLLSEPGPNRPRRLGFKHNYPPEIQQAVLGSRKRRS
jgi:4-hydroxy-3-polyprenylbenzoate decarboxylase